MIAFCSHSTRILLMALILFEEVPDLHGCFDIAIAMAEADASDGVGIAGADKAGPAMATVFDSIKADPGSGATSRPVVQTDMGAVMVVDVG